MDYTFLIGVGLDSLKSLIANFTKAKAPQEIIDGLNAAYENIEKHGQDIMTKEEWEALRN